MSGEASRPPVVTIILPTYNRATFLPDAFASIASQTRRDWELIVVDDGSTDETPAIVQAHERELGAVRYVRQENRGAYAARNRGLDEARGRFVAFYDSDDLWLPHHLQRCVDALERHDVDWVWGSCREVDFSTGRTLSPTTFEIDGQPRPFRRLETRSDNGLKIITDPRLLECHILHGLYCGLQNSVMRRAVFDRRRFDERSRVAEDDLFVVRLLAEGGRFAYFEETHVIYRVHGQNSSASAGGLSIDKHVEIYTELTTGFEDILQQATLTRRERRAILRRLSREYFWHLGYVGYWQTGHRQQALKMFKRGLAVWPWHLPAWKTYLLARFKVAWQGTNGSAP